MFIFLLATSVYAQEMRIGLIRSVKATQLRCDAYQGSYHVYGDSILLGDLAHVQLKLSGGKVQVNLNNGIPKVFSIVRIIQDSLNSSFKIKTTAPVVSKHHFYRDNLEVTADGSRLRIVNLVGISNYLGGVIESEGGGGRHLEYYKVQALMSRTYALKNKVRHKEEGFYLCDGVHCQAYHNMLRRTPLIKEAVEATRGEVIVDENGCLIPSYFAANCGGQTCDPSYVWNKSVPFLEPFMDTFCVHTKQAEWSKAVTKYQWKTFLEKEYGVLESVYGDLLYNFDGSNRTAFYIHPSLGVPMRDLRKKFRLKSAYFSTELKGNEVLIKGRGFGHGVGLCQEGAMQMAKSGFNYKQIALFYFENVRIINEFNQYFFQQEAHEID